MNIYSYGCTTSEQPTLQSELANSDTTETSIRDAGLASNPAVVHDPDTKNILGNFEHMKKEPTFIL